MLMWISQLKENEMKKMLKLAKRINGALRESDESEDSINALTICLACAISTLSLEEQEDCMEQTTVFLQKTVKEIQEKKANKNEAQ